jgi:ribosomal protein S15
VVVCIRPAAIQATPAFLPVTQVAHLSQKEKKRRALQDPYKWAQAQQRKAANVKRQEEIQRERDSKWGDPVHGIPTPFVESFDSAGQATTTIPRKDASGKVISEARELPTSQHLLNHMLTKGELDDAIQHSYILTKPVKSENRDIADPVLEEEETKRHEGNHKRAVEALNRIASLDNASSKMKRHVNFRRCIETFGRHNTNKFLEPRPASIDSSPIPQPEISGPDTGSSEVQIAILTVKIRKLAQELGQNRGYKDKHNKRNLRLLVHRRQKLIRYMEKRERGSGRWTHMIEQLGLSPATYKGAISL